MTNKKYKDGEIVGITEFRGVRYNLVYKEKENKIVYEKAKDNKKEENK